MPLLRQTILLIAVTLIPALELRASIPYGILGSERWGITEGLMPWPSVVLVCVVANILLGFGVFWILMPIMRWLEKFAWFSRWFAPILTRMQYRIQPYVDKYGEIGVALFIGIPLPGSGVYTGAVGAFLLGLDKRKFAVANVLGVCIAAAAVTALTLAIQAGMDVPWADILLKAKQ
ncbi:MAG: small multi-drug export protein [Lentisphaeria bacterium]